MLKSFINKLSSTPEGFLKELFKKNIDVKALQSMLDGGKFSINYQNEEGDTFLHLCIINNKFKSAKWLIENGIDVTLINRLNQEPIQLAIKKNNHLIVELILKTKNVDINQLDQDGRSLLQNAVLDGNEEIAFELINNAIDVNSVDKNNRNVVFDAVAYGDEQLINKIIDVEDVDLNLVDCDGETILHKSETLANEDLCIKLVEKGADPTICDGEGKNLLYHTAIKGMEGSRLIDVAIEHGCNINATVRNNNTILMETMLAFYKIPDSEASRRESLLKMAENLVVKGIDVNAINDDGENGLFDAIRNNDYNACAFLLGQKVDVNKQNNKYQTPLLIACLEGIVALDIVLLLLKHGANASIKNENNQDVLEILNELTLHTHNYKKLQDEILLEYAQKEKQFILIIKEILQNSLVNVQHLDSKGRPLFFTPLLDGYYDLFKLYIMNKFDINSLDARGLNIFYVYVFTVFSVNKYFDTFRSNLIGMINFGVDINLVDSDGKNIFSKIIKHDTEPKLFEALVDVSRFKYESRDKQGRTVCHHAVLNKNLEIVKLIYAKNEDVINIADGYSILPIVYAALTDRFDIVKEILGYSNVYIKAKRAVPMPVRVKFAPMVAKVDNLKTKTTDKDLLRKITILTDQIKSDFKVEG
jgi:ankyrin repeat protein